MRLAILGGSFNPLHSGHFVLADEVRQKFGYDCILFVPVWQPPHKSLAEGASAEQRLQMIKNAVRDIKQFAWEDCEIRRQGVSYTIDTIDYLESKYEGRLEGKIGLIIGDDLVSGFSKWCRADELAERTDLILANRLLPKTSSSNTLAENSESFGASEEPFVFPYRHKRIDNPIFPVSSSDIRSRISEGYSWRFFVPESVYRYIKQNKLYGCKDCDESKVLPIDSKALSLTLSPDTDILSLIDRVRKYALASEKMPRYEHSVRVAETAAQMCRLYGEDAALGYLAGIGHDICKEMSDKLLFSVAGRDGEPIDKIEEDRPSLLHGRAAAMILQNDFGVRNHDVIEAVRNHTFGKPGLSNLAKIIFAADKIEPGRDHVTPEYLSRLFSLSLDGLVREVVQENISYLEKKGKVVAPVSRRFLQSLSGGRE